MSQAMTKRQAAEAGRKGGKARAEKLSPRKRKAIARLGYAAMVAKARAK